MSEVGKARETAGTLFRLLYNKQTFNLNLCLYVCKSTYVQVPMEPRSLISWSSSYRQLWTTRYGYEEALRASGRPAGALYGWVISSALTKLCSPSDPWAESSNNQHKTLDYINKSPTAHSTFFPYSCQYVWVGFSGGLRCSHFRWIEEWCIK